MMQTIVHSTPGSGALYFNESRARFATRLGGELFIRESPRAVVFGDNGEVFLRERLQCASWENRHERIAIATPLAAEVSAHPALLAKPRVTKAPGG